MNPLTLVKQIQSINSKELDIDLRRSILARQVQRFSLCFRRRITLRSHGGYGEVVDVNLVRDKGTGKSKGFVVAYEDQRSTNLAVDNLNGANVLGRIIKVEHCSEYSERR